MLLVTNKVDLEENEDLADEFIRLGLGQALCVSAEHGRGITDLEAAIDEKLVQSLKVARPIRRIVSVSLLGRPNVGKSSIGNRLLKSTRLIVSDVRAPHAIR